MNTVEEENARQFYDVSANPSWDECQLRLRRKHLKGWLDLESDVGITYCYNGHRVTWDSGVDIGADAGPFCPTCMAISPGRYVELGKPKPPDPTWDCECGAEMPTAANYCGRCGKEWEVPF